ncbi:hypothetical protein LguiA_014421 [Lonicera macranthoides]
MASSSFNGNDLANAWSNIVIDDEENSGIVIPHELAIGHPNVRKKWALVGRLLTDKVINFSAMQQSLISLRRPAIGISQGLICSKACIRVGDGTSIRVFKNPCLPDPNQSYVFSPVDVGLEDLSVSFLKIELNGYWDGALLTDLFNSRDIKLILYIPLSRINSEDVWYWWGSVNGNYSVKHGYRCLMEARNSQYNY